MPVDDKTVFLYDIVQVKSNNFQFFSFKMCNFSYGVRWDMSKFFSCLHLSKISPSSSINNKLYLVLKYARKLLTLSHSPPISQDCGLQIKTGIIIRTHIQLHMYSKVFSLHLIVNQLLFWVTRKNTIRNIGILWKNKTKH